MEHDLQFDVAFSYAAEDAWIAKDLYNLIAQSGLSVYCYDFQADRAFGFLRSRLLDIYRDARLNVVVWSQNYATAVPDSFPSMERRCIINRHIEKGAAESLFVLRADNEPLSRELDMVLVHDLRRLGLLSTARLLIERIGKISAQSSPSGLSQHPPGTEATRGQLRPCRFSIDPQYQADQRGRWRELADVLVNFPNPLRTRHVYLIPSGSCSPLLRHPVILRSDPELLQCKREATEEFVHNNLPKSIEGFWFPMRKGEAEVATVYAPLYDKALNASLQKT
jgi:hypothetical protein